MAYDTRNDHRRTAPGVNYYPKRAGRREFASLDELAKWERICGAFTRKGSEVRKVVIPASLGYPAQVTRVRIFWGRN